MGHKYIILYGETPEELSKKVTEHLGQGWDLWGNPFPVKFTNIITFPPDGNRYCPAVVRFDPSGHSVVGKVETVLSEPAGFSVGVPETSEVIIGCDGPAAESAIRRAFSGSQCCCYEKVGDNPGCPVHCGVPSGMIS